MRTHRLPLALFCSLLLSARPVVVRALLRYDPEDYYKIADGGVSEGKWAPLVAAGDFDGDGHADVLIPKATGGVSFNATLYRGRGDGLFPAFPEVLHATGHLGEATAVVAGDLNGDGRADAVIGRSRNYFANEPYALLFALLSSSGGGGVEYVPVVADDEVRGPSGAAVPVDRVHAIRLADLDNDGDLDIVAVVTDWDAGAVLYLENIDGTGRTYKQHVLFDELLGYGCIDVGDMDNDGDDDIVVLSGGRDLMWILSNKLQSGEGFTLSLVDTSARFPRSVAVGDLDGDGWPDIVKGGNYQLSIYQNKRDGTFQKLTIDEAVDPIFDGDAYTQVTIRDVDGDGLTDIITPGNSRIKWARQVEPYRFSEVEAYFKSFPGVYYSEATLVFADLNEDGIGGDMIVKDTHGAEVKVYFCREVAENTSPSFSTTASTSTSTSREENQDSRHDQSDEATAPGTKSLDTQPASGAKSSLSFQVAFWKSITILFVVCMIYL